MKDVSESLEVAVRGEVLSPTASLSDLTERANQEHGFVEEALGQALDHVIKSGEALSEVRRIYAHQFHMGWRKWIEDNFNGGHVVASYYIRIYEYRDLVDGLPNVNQAMQRLQGMPAVHQPGYRGYSEEIREEARTLHANGVSQAEISRILGVNPTTIKTWIDPKELARQRKRIAEDSKRRQAEKMRKKKEAAQRAAERDAKRVGGALAEAYSLVHKLEAPLARAEQAATDPEVKEKLAEASANYRKMLYRVVEALGAS